VRQDILDVLIAGVIEGAREVLAVRGAGQVTARYKDATELVTLADERSDHAIRVVFEERLHGIDSEIVLRLEESGGAAVGAERWVGADPIDGTSHFAAGGAMYSVQAHYVDRGVAEIGVVFQPEVYLPLAESDRAIGRLVYAIRGGGAWVERTEYTGASFVRGLARRVIAEALPRVNRYVACVPISTKMNREERELAQRVLGSELIAVTAGSGGAGGNVMMTLFGGMHVYANLGAGEDLDLIPPQVIAIEAGLTVWGVDRKPPLWHVKKQPFIAAHTDEIAERFLQAAGL